MAATVGDKSPPDLFYSFRPRSGEVLTVKYISSGARSDESGILSGSSSGAVDLWSLKTKRSMWHSDLSAAVILVDTCYIQQEYKVLSQSRGGVIDLWDLALHRSLSIRIDDPGFCKVATFDRRSKFASCFVAPHSGCKINLHNFENNQLVGSFSDESYKARGLCMSIKTLYNSTTGINYILGGFEDGSVLVWDERQLDKFLCCCSFFSDPVFTMAVDGSSMKGMVGSHHETLQSFCISLQQGTLEGKYSIKLKNPGVADIVVRSDSKIFATGGWDGRVRVFGWSKGKSLAVMNFHSSCVNSVNFASHPCLDNDSNLLICGSKDGVISTWKIY